MLDRLEDAGCNHYAYADDVAIVAKISTKEEIEAFNGILDILLKWGIDYEMKWGAHKTKKVLGLKEQLIFNDLKLMHQIKHGRSPVDFDEFFTISDIERNGKGKIEPNSFKHSFAKHSFTRCIHMY